MGKSQGNALVEKCKGHVLATMRALPECAPSGPGLRNKDLERAAGLGLNLSQHDGWLCWSLLMVLVDEGKVDVVRRGKGAIRYFRLKATN